jgi:hypothetical protein
MHWIDPDHLPEITGTVDQFLVNKHGEADGFLLTDGEEVHVPPHLSARLLRDVRPGSQVKVRGVRPRGVKMTAAVAIDTPKGRILDEGPKVRDDGEAFEKAKHGPMSAQGIVKRPIHGRRARPAAPYSRTVASSGCRRMRPSDFPICWQKARGFRRPAKARRPRSERLPKPARSAPQPTR